MILINPLFIAVNCWESVIKCVNCAIVGKNLQAMKYSDPKTNGDNDNNDQGSSQGNESGGSGNNQETEQIQYEEPPNYIERGYNPEKEEGYFRK